MLQMAVINVCPQPQINFLCGTHGTLFFFTANICFQMKIINDAWSYLKNIYQNCLVQDFFRIHIFFFFIFFLYSKKSFKMEIMNEQKCSACSNLKNIYQSLSPRFLFTYLFIFFLLCCSLNPEYTIFMWLGISIAPDKVLFIFSSKIFFKISP